MSQKNSNDFHFSGPFALLLRCGCMSSGQIPLQSLSGNHLQNTGLYPLLQILGISIRVAWGLALAGFPTELVWTGFSFPGGFGLIWSSLASFLWTDVVWDGASSLSGPCRRNPAPCASTNVVLFLKWQVSVHYEMLTAYKRLVIMSCSVWLQDFYPGTLLLSGSLYRIRYMYRKDNETRVSALKPTSTFEAQVNERG